MSALPSVGVIGVGFVGDAVAHGFRGRTCVRAYDVDPARGPDPFAAAAGQDVVFVCVPTPSSSDSGRCDLAIMDAVFERLGALWASEERVGLVAVKSSVPPGTSARYAVRYPGLHVASNPEFLTQRTARRDFADPASVVIGAAIPEDFEPLTALYAALAPRATVVRCSRVEAEMIKYARNCFYAVKVAAFNEFAQVCRALNCDYETVRRGVLAGGWVHPMHTLVPGPDGDLGFGGKCLPKDAQALAALAGDLGVDPVMLRAALEKNAQVRSRRDWLDVEGAFTK